MHDAVADRLDHIHVVDDAVLGIGQSLDDEVDRDRVIGTFVFGGVFVFALGHVGDESAFQRDAFHDADREDVLCVPIVDLIFGG